MASHLRETTTFGLPAPPALAGAARGFGIWGLGSEVGSGVWGVFGENGFCTIGPQNRDLGALLPGKDSYGRPASFFVFMANVGNMIKKRKIKIKYFFCEKIYPTLTHSLYSLYLPYSFHAFYESTRSHMGPWAFGSSNYYSKDRE